MKTAMANVIINGIRKSSKDNGGYTEERTLSDPNAGKVYRNGQWVSIKDLNHNHPLFNYYQ